MNEEEYEELARWLPCHPGRWVAWPEPFGTRAEADALFESLRDADSERIDCWHCLSWLANHRRSAVESLSNAEKKRLASRLGFEWIAGEKRP